MEMRPKLRCTVVLAILVFPSSVLMQTTEVHVSQPKCEAVCKYTAWALDADCKDCNLVYVPTQCREVKTLDLRHNPISILPNGVFDGFTELRYLDIEMIQLEVIEPGAFSDNVNLIHIYLQANSLTIIRSFTFKGAPNLTQLFLNSNAIHTLEDGAFDGVSKLQTLFLSDNNLTDISSDIFRNLTNLRYLYIDNNRISTIREGTFKSLINLRHLSLAGNTLTYIPQGALDDLKHLRALKLSFNQIISFSPLPKLPKLTHVDLYNNKLTSIKNLTNILNLPETFRKRRQTQDGERFINVYLGNNPLNCTCDMEPVRVWMVTHLDKIQNHHRTNATCASPTDLTNAPISKQGSFCPVQTTTIKSLKIAPANQILNHLVPKPTPTTPNNQVRLDKPKPRLMPITIAMVTVSCVVLFLIMLWIGYARLKLSKKAHSGKQCSNEKSVNVTCNPQYEPV